MESTEEDIWRRSPVSTCMCLHVQLQAQVWHTQNFKRLRAKGPQRQVDWAELKGIRCVTILYPSVRFGNFKSQKQSQKTEEKKKPLGTKKNINKAHRQKPATIPSACIWEISSIGSWEQVCISYRKLFRTDQTQQEKPKSAVLGLQTPTLFLPCLTISFSAKSWWFWVLPGWN